MEQSEQIEKELLATARNQVKHYLEIKHFEDGPGIGFVIAATISAILETRYLFANKIKVWMYAGLDIMIGCSLLEHKRSLASQIFCSIEATSLP